MKREWISSQLEILNYGNSISRFIPPEIGWIIYCDTSEPRMEPYTKKIKKIESLFIFFIGLDIIWFFLYSHNIWTSILSLILIGISYSIWDSSFSGKDYFVGGKGIIHFEDKRDNITQKQIFLFENLSYLFTGETINKTNYTYSNTSYYFVFNEILKENKYKVTYKLEGTYSDKNPKDLMNPDGADGSYSFMKETENAWTKYYFYKHKDDGKIYFSLYNKDTIFSDYIKMTKNNIIVDNIECTRNNIKRIYVQNGQIVIEHQNHSSKLFGLLEKGDISHIPLSNLGNRKSFLLLFDKYYQV